MNRNKKQTVSHLSAHRGRAPSTVEREDADFSVAGGVSRPSYLLLLPNSELVIADESAEAHGLIVTNAIRGGAITRRLAGPAQLASPTGLALRATEDDTLEVIAGEQGRGRLARISAGGAVIGREESALARSPLDVIVAAGRLFVSDVCFEKIGTRETAECIGRIVIYNARTLKHVHTIDSSSLPGAGARFHPHGLAALPGPGNKSGRLYVADADSGCLWVFSFRGELLERIGTMGTGPLQFVHPRGLLMWPTAVEDAPLARAGGGELPPSQVRGRYLVVAERARVQVLLLPSKGGGEAVRSVQILDFEPGSNLLGLCALNSERILIADVGKDRIAALRVVRAMALTVE